MGNFTVDGRQFQNRPLDCFQQFAISVKLMPILGELKPLLKHYAMHRAAVAMAVQAQESGEEAPEVPDFDMELVSKLGAALNVLKDDERNAVLRMCLQSCMIANSGAPGLLPLWSPTRADPPPDINMVTMLKIVWAVIEDNLQGFGIVLPSISSPAGGTK